MSDTAAHSEIRYELVAESAPAAAHEAPIALLRRVLRGRLVFTLCVMVLLGTIGGVAGYTAVRPTYESTGLLNFKGTLPTILYDSSETAAADDFNSFVSMQINYLQSHDVLGAALQHPDIVALGWPTDAKGVARLRGLLDIRRERGTQIVGVTATHPEPFVAQTAVNAVLSTFERMSVDPTIDSLRTRQAALEQRETELEEEIAQVQTRILVDSDQYGADGLATIHASKVEELLAVEQKLSELRIARTKVATGEAMADEVVALTGATNDPFSRLAEEERLILEDLRNCEGRFGPAHPLVRRLNRQLESVRNQMTLQRGTDGGATVITVADASAARIASLIEQYETLRTELEHEVTTLSQRRVAIGALVERADNLERQLSAAQHHLDIVRMEARREDRQRVAIAAWGDYPLGAARDRRSGLAAAGVLFGLIGGGAIIVLVGVVDPRARYIDDLAIVHGEPALLGALPELDRRGITRTRANRTVHQVRNLLEIQTADPSRNVYAITSATGGEGRTSLALALAGSFAAADRRTLLIDADLASAGVTAELGLQNAPGLCEAIGPDDTTGRVHRMQRANLWTMPIGAAHGVNARDLSRTKLVALLDALRERFDAIIVDTGAMRTSVEASLVTALADRTVMVVERNQRITHVQDALARLGQVGATIAGAVFNRALPSDFSDETAQPRSTRQARRNGPANLLPRAITRDATLDVFGANGSGAVAATIRAATDDTTDESTPSTRRHAA